MSEVTAIQCDNCGRLLDSKDKERFYTFYGNVTLGLDEQLIGNNIDREGKLKDEVHYCKFCLTKIFLLEGKLDKP